jgi:hypothetical protein
VGANGRKVAEIALGINDRSDPGNVKGTDGKSNFVLDKRDRKTSVRADISGDLRSRFSPR